ncbi:DUF2461 domain-containing protein [Chitinophaga sp. Hz27]|uniref:DUF2461 domain-containing protein n=1 Tax=Chitinophaga sp. Hz27 TaxID=3347169 RepID=UPI0035D80BBE
MAKQQKTGISPKAFTFLEKLRQHNNREWFNEHKPEFQEQQQDMEVFAEALLQKMNAHDVLETPSGKSSLYRIYRDVRFSNDKTPYKTHWSGSFKRATKQRRGGYYFHIEHNNSFIGGGFWGPSADDLRLVREDIAFDDAPLRKIIQSKNFVKNFGSLEGEQLKTAPKGFPNDHSAIDLLRYKQYLVLRKFSDEEVLSPSFLDEADKTFQAMRPFLDYMSEVLSSDGNGA